MSVTLEGVLASGLDDVQGSVDVEPFREAYLEPFARYSKRASLEAASTTAMRLGWVSRAVNAHLGGSDAARARVHLRMFLDGRPWIPSGAQVSRRPAGAIVSP